jgi:hypothetical protein
MSYGGKWHVGGYHDAFWLLSIAALGEGVPKGAPVPARAAVSLLDEWFPEGPGEATRAGLLADICAEIDRSHAPDAQPPSRLKQTVARALADGRLAAYRVKADVPGARRLELQDAEETRPPEEVSHWVRFEVHDQFHDEAGDVKLGYRLLFDKSKLEGGTLAKSGKLDKTGVKKGSYSLVLEVLSEPSWSEVSVVADKTIELGAKSNGFEDDAVAKVHVYDARALHDKAIATLTGAVRDNAVLVEWTPDADTLAKASSSEVLFIAEVGERRVMSLTVPARVEREIVVELDGQPAPNGTRVVAVFSGGTSIDQTTTDGKVRGLVGAGERLVSLDLPRSLARLEVKPEQGDEQAYRLPGVA